MKFLDLKKEHEHYDWKEVLTPVFENVSFINGPQVAQFEEEFASYCGTGYAVGVGSGTNALEVALLTLGINCSTQPVVLTSPYTFIATTEIPHRLGARVIFCDIKEDFNIDIEQVKEIISSRKVNIFIPVHLFGKPVSLDKELIDLCNEKGVVIIEDAAQATGTRFISNEKSGMEHVGSFGDIGCFSFFPAKNLGCAGDGGAVIMKDWRLYEKAKMIRNHGSKSKNKYWNKMHGGNFRLDSIQAAILSAKLKHIGKLLKSRANTAKVYNEQLKYLQEDLVLPFTCNTENHTYNQFVMRIKNGRRDALKDHLKQLDIPTVIYYPKCLSEQPCYTGMDFENNCPNSKQAASDNLALPIAYLSEEERSRVIDGIKNFYNR